MIPPRTKCKLTWDVFKVLHFLKDLYHLKKLTLKILTWKLVTMCTLNTTNA